MPLRGTHSGSIGRTDLGDDGFRDTVAGDDGREGRAAERVGSGGGDRAHVGSAEGKSAVRSTEYKKNTWNRETMHRSDGSWPPFSVELAGGLRFRFLQGNDNAGTSIH